MLDGEAGCMSGWAGVWEESGMEGTLMRMDGSRFKASI